MTQWLSSPLSQKFSIMSFIRHDNLKDKGKSVREKESNIVCVCERERERERVRERECVVTFGDYIAPKIKNRFLPF